jgi:aryl carrier-like protein
MAAASDVVALQRICAEILAVPDVGPDDDLVMLGADSIAILRIVGVARSECLSVSISSAFARPTINGMLEPDDVPDAESASADPTGDATRPDEWLPITPAQAKLLKVFAEPERSTLYLVLRIGAMVDLQPFIRAVTTALARHDGLWMRPMRVEGGGWKQQRPAARRDVDITTVESAAEEAAWARIRDDNEWIPLDRTPLYRCTLHRVSGQKALLHLVFHHLVIDAIGVDILLRDIQAAHDQERGFRADLPPAGSLWVWSQWLRTYRAGLPTRRVMDRWLEYAAGSENVMTPIDQDHGANVLEHTEVATVTVAPDQTQRLKELVTRNPELTLEGCVLGALAAGYARTFEQPGFRTMFTRSGRLPVPDGPDTSSIVGWLVYHFPVSVTVDPAASAQTLATLTCARLAEAPDAGLSYGLLDLDDNDAEVADMMTAIPADEMTFIYHGSIPDVARYPDFEEIGIPPAWTSRLRGPRTVYFQVTAGIGEAGLRLAIRYSTRHHRFETMRRWLDLVGAFLADLAATSASVRLDGE